MATNDLRTAELLSLMPRYEIIKIIENFRDALAERSYIIAKLFYSYGFTDMEIAAVTRTTPQNISGIRANILKTVSRQVAKQTNSRRAIHAEDAFRLSAIGSFEE